jgi:chromosome segregation ATPase
VVFSLGNILTLLIVFLFFVLTRWLDRGNRKLERARDYGKQLKEQLKEELGAFIREKEQAVKDYGVELNVEVNAAKKLKTNIDESVAELRAKTAEMDAVSGAIADYAANIKELSSMTGRVQENLRRIEDESLFVEDVGRKIGVVSKAMERIEGDISAMKTRIEENVIDAASRAADAIEKNAAVLLEPVRYTVSELRVNAESIEKQVAEHRELIEKNVRAQCAEIEQAEAARAANVARDMRQINELLRDVTEKAGERASALESAMFEKLSADAQERGRALKEDIHKKIDDLFSGANDRIGDVSNELTQSAERLRDGLEEMRHKHEESGRLWNDDIENMRETIRQETEKLNVVKREIEAELESLSSGTGGEIGAIRERVRENLAALSAELTGHFEQLKSGAEKQAAAFAEDAARQFTALESALDGKFGALEAGAEEKFGALQSGVDAKAAGLESEALRRFESLKARIEGQLEGLDKDAAARFDSWSKLRDETLAEIERLSQGARENARALAVRLDADVETAGTAAQEKILAIERIISSHTDSVDQRLDEITRCLEERAEDAKQNALRIADERLEEYRCAQEQNYRNLSAVADDADALEKELRHQIETVTQRIQKEYAQFEADSSARRDRLAGDWAAALETVGANIAALSQELDAIKAEAARSVSEKARLFEESFVASLARRGEKTDELFERWQADAAERLEFLQKETEERCRDSELSAAENLRKNCAEIESRVTGELNRLKDEAAVFESGIRDEMRLADKSVEAFKEQLAASLRDARENAEFELKAVIAQQTVDNAEKLKICRNDLETSLKSISAQIEDKTKDLSQRFESAQREAAHIEDTIQQRLSGAEESCDKKLVGVNSSLEKRLREFNLDIEQQMQAASESYNEQIQSLNGTIADLIKKNEELSARGDERLSRLTLDIEKITGEAEERGREILEQTEGSVKDLRDKIKGAAEKIDDFYSQSKLIEKSMELKEDLSKKIDALKIDLDRLEQRRSEVDRLEAQIKNMRRLEDDVRAKMDHFLTEEGRVALMEKNFERLLHVSRSVEEKLVQVTSSDDTLQEMAIKLRQISDSMNEVEEKYQRLEKKKLTLDATTERIDINFTSLEESEKRAAQFQGELDRLAAELEKSGGDLRRVLEETRKAMEVSGKVSVLDAELEHIEERIRQMQAARQWLADIENRLDEKYRQIKGSVKAMGAAQAAATSAAGSRVSGDMQSEVRSLKRRGWTKEEIAGNLKISVGEVELILEINPDD